MSWSQQRVGATAGPAGKGMSVQVVPVFSEYSAWLKFPAAKIRRPLFAAAGSARVLPRAGSLARGVRALLPLTEPPGTGRPGRAAGAMRVPGPGAVRRPATPGAGGGDWA